MSTKEDPRRRPDSALLARLRRVARAALVADALDQLGLRAQCMRPDIRPLAEGSVLVGHAFTARCEPVDGPPDQPYVGLLAALDAIGPEEVMVLATAASDRAAVWGELVSNACRSASAAGALTDGLVRDVAAVRALGFPVFARGAIPYDVNGRFEVEATAEPQVVGGVTVRNGDLLVADDDGVVVVPPDVREQVVERVLEKAEGENRFRDAVASGMSASRAYELFGVL